MTNIRKTAISFTATLALWIVFSWPLPKYLFCGIPSLAHPSSVDVQVMTAGDHLQFLYHCQLVDGMLAGDVPWFHNLYEFNIGNDAERFRVEPYYVPFSLVYALGARIGGPAFGWNLTGFLSLWLTFLFSWMLAARYASSEWITGCTAAVSVALPYRWICLLGGSPTGFAMMWVPMILLGVDMAVRDERMAGGFLAGMAILFASWTDQHVFFFSVLAVPPWCVLAFVSRGRWNKSWLIIARGISFALLPVIALTIAAALLPGLMEWITKLKAGYVPADGAVGTRTLSEVRLYSPGWQGLFTWHVLRKWGEIYVGFSITALLVGGGLAIAARVARERKANWRALAVFLLLILGMTGIIFLALGTNGPCDALLLRVCRRVIPPYGMIRQPAKIFCLLPSFLTVALAVGLAALGGLCRKTAWRLAAITTFVLLVLAEYGLRMHPHVCLLDDRQEAYESVAGRAADKGVVARALVVPLWPGDSHYASVYQYYAALHRVRIINGYTPFVKRGYFDNVFCRFQSVNQGELSDDQIEALLEMGVEAIVVHEDLFPEKVSPFPVTFTLRQLIVHPRLSLLKQNGCVWAFEILPQAVEKEESASWNMFGAARIWEAENCLSQNALLEKEPAAQGGAFVVLDRPGARIFCPGEFLGRALDVKWMVRARGEGMLSADIALSESLERRIEVPVQSEDWIWLTIPTGVNESYARRSLSLELLEGTVALDSILLAAGEWGSPEPGHSLRIPAPAFFHAGYINRERNSVVLRRDYHANVFVFYGPKLPLAKGVYEVEIVFQTEAPSGTQLGWFNVRRRAEDPERRNAVVAGKRAAVLLNHTENTVVNVEFVLFRNADVEIDEVVFRRMD